MGNFVYDYNEVELDAPLSCLSDSLNGTLCDESVVPQPQVLIRQSETSTQR